MTLTVEAPGSTQREEALARANKIRSWRAQAKRKMTLQKAVALIYSTPWIAETWKVSDVMKACPGWGPTKVNALLARHQLTGQRTLGTLTERQRRALIQSLTR